MLLYCLSSSILTFLFSDRLAVEFDNNCPYLFFASPSASVRALSIALVVFMLFVSVRLHLHRSDCVVSLLVAFSLRFSQ